VEEAEEELFKVEKIVDSKLDKNGVPLYKTRWKGYSASDDTWEPPENVASTGHIDRYERQQRQRTLKKSTAGVAVIEYEDGEREMVNMKIEKFRGYRPDSSDEGRDDDSDDGDDDVNNFRLVVEGEWIEILWRKTNMYFPCKIIFWTPLRATKSHRKSTGNSSRRGIFEDVEESSPVKSKQKDTKRTSKKSKRGDDVTSRGKRQPEFTASPAKNSQPELALASRGKRQPESGVTAAPAKKSQPELALTSRGKRQPEFTASPAKNSQPELALASRGKRQPESGVTAAPAKKSQPELALTSRGKRQPEFTASPAKNSQPELALEEPTQQMFWRDESEPIESKTGVQEEDQHDSDDYSINSESSGLSDDIESHSDRLVERIGHGIPLFDEPEDDFDSSDDDSDDDDDEGVNSYQYPSQHEGPKLSFEELWTLKLKRTQELMDRSYNGNNGIH